MTATLNFPRLKEEQGKLDAARKELRDVFAEAGPDYDMDKVKSLSGDRKAKVEWIQAKNKEIDAQKAEVDELRSIFSIAQDVKDGETESGSEPGEPQTKDGGRRAKSLGELFVKSQAFKGFKPGSDGPGAHLDIDLKTLFQTSAGWEPESTRSGLVTMFPTRPAPHVVDAIPQITTNQAAYKYMEETTFTNNSAEAAEGATYGEAALVLTQRTQDVEKIAVWLPVTDEQLEDEPGAQGYVENRLQFMARQRLDSQVLVGNGTAPNLLGTENVTGIQTQALGTDPIPDAIYKLFTKIRDDGFSEPSVVYIRPSKWETVRLLRTADGQYIWGHPALPGPETIWGVPVVQTTAVTATKAVAGDYRTHAFLAVRRGIDIKVSNSHSSDFVNGKQAIRADFRVVMVHVRPKAFGTVTGL